MRDLLTVPVHMCWLVQTDGPPGERDKHYPLTYFNSKLATEVGWSFRSDWINRVCLINHYIFTA